MTYAEAIALRARELSGAAVPAAHAREALQIINASKGTAPARDTLPTRLLRMLANGAVERPDFYDYARKLYAEEGRAAGPHAMITELQNMGLIRQEVQLTEKGRKRIEAKP